ncbi:MAG TPA: EAL domain-containing protein [Longimicrobiaceae bacterium]|nr:EAL domain-containing protein [Longimicrobiaceae bacterium]
MSGPPDSGERYRALWEEAAHAAFATGADGRFVEANPAAAALFGYRREELLGLRLADLYATPEDGEALELEMERAGALREREVRLRRRDGSVLACEVTAAPRRGEGGMQGIVQDVTARKRAEVQLAYGALHDPLTGLPNRHLFLSRLEQAVKRLRRRGEASLAVLALDLDRFALVNDFLGHDAGDELLRALAARLADALRPGDTAARSGGDEFTVLLEDVPDALAATRVAQRVLASLAAPFQLRRYEVSVTASVGITMHAGGGATPDDLLRDAGTALARARSRGRGRFEVFDPEVHDAVGERLRLEAELRTAAERGELRLEYEPLVAVEEGAVTGFGALLRWEHPARGPLPAGEFVPVADGAGAAVPLAGWMLGEACRQLRAWRERFPERGLTLWVRLSPRQLARPELAHLLSERLAETGMDPAALRLEVAEGALTEYAGAAAAMLARWKEVGVGLCAADFGSGPTSLGDLHRLPVDAVAVAPALVATLVPGAGAGSVVPVLAALAHDLRLTVVAEGVETAEQLQALRALRCEYARGPFFGPPLDAAGADRFLADAPRW